MNNWLEQALQRPLDYRRLFFGEQENIDKKLGIHGVKPTAEEDKEYRRRRACELRKLHRRPR
jgi:hypothetical protein